MRKNRKPKEYSRLQFDFSKDAIDRLDDLVDLTDSSSRAEVVRNALRVYEFFVTKTKEDGFAIELKKDDQRVAVAPLPV